MIELNLTLMQIVLGRAHIEAVNGTVPSQLRLTSRCSPEVESSRTHFKVLGLEGQVLGLGASSPRELACPRLEDSTFF